MSAWIVYSKDGKTQRCELKRLEYSGSHMGERAVTATFEHHSEVAFDVFDYIVYRGEKFELESIPSVKKVSRNEYEYELRFVSLKYELERCEMRDIVPNDNGVVYPTPLTFSFTGDVRYLAERIQANLDALYGKGVWNIVVAEGVSSDEKNISIAQQNCWNALSLVNTTYGLNFSVRGREVVIGGEIDAVSHTFQYGKGNGLYEIERASDTEIGIVTKLRAYGSTKNLDYSYPKKPEWADSALPVSFALSPLRLMLPSFKEDGKTDYVLADDAVISKYGIREASIVYEDIYPSIAGATNENGEAIDEIASVDEIDESKSTFVVYLRDLGFDLEEHLTTSEAQLSMKTGTLQGYTFNISVIDRLSNGGYKLTLGRNSVEGSEESGFNVPNNDWNMKAGDKFVLLNILMPQAYIREAEQRLLIRAKEYLAEYGKTNFSYNVGLHDKFLVEHPSVYDSLVEGVKLRVQDNELGISEDVIIQSITITEASDDNILPQVKVTLNNKPSASTLDRIQGKLNDVIAETSANNFSSQNELMAQYRKKLDKPFFDKLFSAVDANGNEIASNDVSTPVAYIKAKYDVLVLGGVTMYGNDESLDLPTLAEGLPYDQRTIWFNPETKQIEVIGGTGGGVSNFWDLSGIPSWITNSKPIYNYSEINGTPDLSVFVTGTALNKTLADYATLTYLTGELKKYVTLDGAQDIKGIKNFVNGLKIGGMPITKKQDDVVYLDANLVVRGGITMYAENEVDIPSILDSLPIASNTALGIASFDSTYFSVDSNGMVSLTSAPSSSASYLGKLDNVDDSIDATASVDRVLYQPAGSAMWVSKPLDEIMIGGGGVTNGEAYKVYEQAMNSNIDVLGAYKGLQLFFNVSNSSIGSVGTYDAVLHVAGSSRGFQLRSVKDSTDFYVRNVTTNGFTDWNKILHSGNYSSYALPISGGTLTGDLTTSNGVRLFLNKGGDGIYIYNEGISFHNSSNNWVSSNIGFYSNGSVSLCPIGGNVGIGTTNPATKLEVNGGFRVTGCTWLRQLGEGYTLGSSRNSAYLPSGTVVYVGSLDNNVSSASLINFDTKAINGGTNGVFIGGVDSGLSNGASNFVIGRRTGTSTWAESLRIDANGNVGIETTSPAYKLDVNGSFGSTSVQVGEIFLGATNEINSTGTRLWINYKGNAQLFLGNNGYPVIVGTYANQEANIQNALNYAPFSVFGTIFGYRYGKKASGAAFMFDKPGSNYTGIGADETTDTIYFGACNKDGDWVDYGQIWKFGGAIVCGALKIHDTNVIDATYGSGVHLNYYGTSDVTFCKGGGNTIAYGNFLTHGGITMYSDKRKKTILNHVELSLKQIADAPLIEHYYNSDQDKTTHVGSIAQYWADMNDWFCKLDNEGYYTMEIQNCALASAISIARHLERYESKTDKKIRQLKKRISQLEDELELLKKGV